MSFHGGGSTRNLLGFQGEFHKIFHAGVREMTRHKHMHSGRMSSVVHERAESPQLAQTAAMEGRSFQQLHAVPFGQWADDKLLRDILKAPQDVQESFRGFIRGYKGGRPWPQGGSLRESSQSVCH
jgi:hypothetical protein